MRPRRVRTLSLFPIVFSTGVVLLAASCSIYDGDIPEQRPDGGTAGASGSHFAGRGGTAGNGGSGGTSTGGAGGTAAGVGGSTGGDGGAMSDAAIGDADAPVTDVAPPRPDALGDRANDATETASPSDGGVTDTVLPSDGYLADASDASIGTDANDAASPNDVAYDGPRQPDADARAPPDADSGTPDADSGPTGPQILPPHGTPIENHDAGGPFVSRCASDEVVTGFVGRAGVQTDAIASTCSRLVGGVLSSPRNLPLNGNSTGGNAFTVTCPANHVAVGIVGRYGHNTMWQEDVTTAIGVVCKNLASSATQTVAITGQPALDAGYTTFREDCTGGRYLTNISGRTDGNSLGHTVQQVGGECNVR